MPHAGTISRHAGPSKQRLAPAPAHGEFGREFVMDSVAKCACLVLSGTCLSVVHPAVAHAGTVFKRGKAYDCGQ